MAKKAPAKRAPRKPPAKPAIDISSLSPEDLQRLRDLLRPPKPPRWWQKIDRRRRLVRVAKAALIFIVGAIAGILIAGGIPIGPDNGPRPVDCLSQAHAADRATQITVLRELAAQPFDGATDAGREQAKAWFNTQRFRNRADDFGVYTDAVAEAIAGN